MLYYLPIEKLNIRYTEHLHNDIVSFLDSKPIDYITLSPEIEQYDIRVGSFLDAGFTSRFKMLQLEMLANYYSKHSITSDDVIFFSDLWFPGIEIIPYMNFFFRVKPKIRGIIHAGSFTDTDFCRRMERWAKSFEEIVFDITDKIFVGSEFIKNQIIERRYVDANKIIVTGLPLDSTIRKEVAKDSIQALLNSKEDIVVFNGRNVAEKQPDLFNSLKFRLANKGIKFVNTQLEGFSKEEYYNILKKAKVVVSFALQENFGFGINEAVMFGCIPVLPNRLVYPEFYGSDYLYGTFDECVYMVEDAVKNYIKYLPVLTSVNKFSNTIIDRWFNDLY